jgi:hypothetical protein
VNLCEAINCGSYLGGVRGEEDLHSYLKPSQLSRKGVAGFVHNNNDRGLQRFLFNQFGYGIPVIFYLGECNSPLECRRRLFDSFD